MSNCIRILFEPKQSDQIFDFCKAEFGSDASGVEVETIVDDAFVELSWAGGTQDHKLAEKLTEAFPAAVIETPSTTGLDLFSRFFNGTQLW